MRAQGDLPDLRSGLELSRANGRNVPDPGREEGNRPGSLWHASAAVTADAPGLYDINKRSYSYTVVR